MDEKDQQTSEQARQYDRILDRLVKQLDESGERSWAYLNKQIEEAVATEQAAEELTKDEASLLRAYLERDLKSMGYFMHKMGESLASWLNFDLDLLEQVMVDRLTALADRTRLDFELLREHLDHDPASYMSDEITVAGTLHCLNCDATQVLTQTGLIQPCEHCGSRFFERRIASALEHARD